MVHRHNKLKLGVLVSGNGTNLQAIIDACEQKIIDAEIKVVLSNNPKAKALQRAHKHGIPVAVVVDRTWENEILERLQSHQVDLVCLAGFMKILSHKFIQKFPNRILNIHPSLLPSFPGLNAQSQALVHGVQFSGVTVHFVDEGCDTGPILLQSVVKILDNDTVESLCKRILKEELKIYPKAIQLIATNTLKIVGRRVIKKSTSKQ